MRRRPTPYGVRLLSPILFYVALEVLLHGVLYTLTRNKEHRASPYIHPMVCYALQIVHH